MLFALRTAWSLRGGKPVDVNLVGETSSGTLVDRTAGCRGC